MRNVPRIKNREEGYLTLQLLIFGFVAVVILSGFVLWADTNLRGGNKDLNRTLAGMIAESGIEYYRWHLAHDSQDFQDGTGQPGPYVHPFFDKDNNRIGEFILDITAPEVGSTIATIRSSGYIDNDPVVEKIIETRLGLPSFARFSAVANADIRFGEGTEIFGLLHSNGGIRFDGLAHNLVTSARTDYDDPDHSGGNEWGVHTHITPVDPLPPTQIPVRTDVFEVGRQVGVPEVDFEGITQDLSQIRTDAIADGFYQASSSVTSFGFDISLRTDGTFDLYEVTALQPRPHWSCYDYGGYSSQVGWGTWSIQSEQLVGNFPLPGNGLIFVEDDIWVRGQIDDAKLTIASARFPDQSSTWANATINEDLEYSNYDGTDVIAIMTQRNINIGMNSEDFIKIDAALVAQNGRVGRYYYIGPHYNGGPRPGCSPYSSRNTVDLFGMIATNLRYGFAYTDGTGYANRNITYDGSLLYGPPPSFPLTGATYETLSWDEIK